MIAHKLPRGLASRRYVHELTMRHNVCSWLVVAELSLSDWEGKGNLIRQGGTHEA